MDFPEGQVRQVENTDRAKLAVGLWLPPELQLYRTVAVIVSRFEDCLKLGLLPPDVHLLHVT